MEPLGYSLYEANISVKRLLENEDEATVEAVFRLEVALEWGLLVSKNSTTLRASRLQGLGLRVFPTGSISCEQSASAL